MLENRERWRAVGAAKCSADPKRRSHDAAQRVVATRRVIQTRRRRMRMACGAKIVPHASGARRARAGAGVAPRPLRQISLRSYLEDVKASPMIPPRDLVRVHDLETHVPFLHAVDPMASHLIIRKTAPDRAPGTAAASLVEATHVAAYLELDQTCSKLHQETGRLSTRSRNHRRNASAE